MSCKNIGTSILSFSCKNQHIFCLFQFFLLYYIYLIKHIMKGSAAYYKQQGIFYEKSR